MLFAFLENGAITQYPIGYYDIKFRFPDIDIPFPMGSIDLPDYGVIKIEPTEPPAFNEKTHYLQEKLPELSGGVWRQKWEVVEFTEEEKQGILHSEGLRVRSQRNKLLRDSDWTQMPDSLAEAVKWRTYRQELRDITKQTGFPWEIVWPEEPA